ncbi:serine protease [Natrialba sp. SSL1]|nr:serine protease [Natrialba sp. SSL1]
MADEGDIDVSDVGEHVSDAIDDNLSEADGTTEMIVRFGSADTSAATSSAEAVNTMQTHAEQSQAEAVKWAETTDGVEFKESFWIANAVLLDVDTDDVSPVEVMRHTGAEELHKNYEVELVDDLGTDDGAEDKDREADSEGETADNNTSDTTYGLDMINATEVWDEHGTQGEGASVAILDTGVDDEHPDLEIDDDNWQEFDSTGEPIDTDPNDGSGHGTHVSGTVVGPEDPDGDVPAYGVAPGAELYHGKVLADDGGGTFAQIIGGMEWAVDDTDADIVSMSLGGDGYDSEMIEPSENARDAGVVLVTSAGNSGDGVSGTPGNVYPNFASGMVDESHDVHALSSGEEITTSAAYPDAPEYWPDEYTVPNAAAPGVDVLSAVPVDQGEYDDSYTGTSMSAPHKAGTFALMVSASGGDADRELLTDAVEETAWKPSDWDEPDNEYDTRYGMGIIDAAAATDMVALDSGIEGTVTDTDGTPVDGATVDVEDGGSTDTDADGYYSTLAAPGEHTVTADAFGFEAESTDVTIEEEETTEQDFELADALGVELAADQPDGVEGGDEVDATITTANADTVTVDLVSDYDEEYATLYVNGDAASFGEPVDVDGGVSEDVTVTVETTEDTAGELALEHTVAGVGDEETVSTGPTTVFDEFIPVAVVDDAGGFGDSVADTLEDSLDEMYDPVVMSSEDAMDDYDVIVVQNLDSANAGDFIDATEGGDTGVVYLDQWGSDSNAIPVHSDETGEPESTGEADLVAPPIEYELTADHEVFDGVGEEGDIVDIHAAIYGDHTWFDGTEFDSIADTVAFGVPAGDGFAVDDDSSTILASSLGYSTFVTDGDYTENADTILANSVEYLSDDAEDGVDFQVEITDTNEPVTEGETLTVDAMVSNAGEEGDTQTVTLADFDGDVVDSTNVGLGESESSNVSLTWETESSDAGDGNVTVESDDDADTHEVTVDELPDNQLTFGDGDHVGIVEETIDIEINTTEDVAGYETEVHFDPDVVQVEGIEGVDFDDPVTNIDNENGTVSMAQAQASDDEAPSLAEFEFEIVGEADQSGSELAFDEENTFLNNEYGEVDVVPIDDTIQTGWLGDVNGDGEFNTMDVTLTQQFLMGEEPTDTFHEEFADMNQNGEIGPGDVTIMLEELTS